MKGRHSESRLSYLTAIALPILTISTIFITFGFRNIISKGYIPVSVFIVTGYPMWFGFVNIYSNVIGVSTRSDPVMTFPRVTQLDLIVAKFVLEAATAIASYFILMIGVIWLFQAQVPEDPVGVLLCYLSCLWVGGSFGLVLCSVHRFVPSIGHYINPILRLGMWASGAVFLAATLPNSILPYVAWNPIFQACEGARQFWVGSYHSPIFDPWRIFLVCVLLTAAGLMLERASRGRIGS
jgi:capsular polysaccharide transport system permease protein